MNEYLNGIDCMKSWVYWLVIQRVFIFKVQQNPAHQDRIPELQSLNVELTKEKLDTMLDGLGKIRDQLSAVAN